MLLADRPEVGVVSTFFTHMEEDSEKKGITMTFPFRPIDVKRSFYIVNSVAHGSAMIRKSILDVVNNYDSSHSPADDYHLWTKIADVADIAIIPESLYWYRVSSGGMTTTVYDELVETADRVVKEQWQKPHFHKSYRAIVSDGRYYKRLDNPFANQIYGQYLEHQIRIAEKLFRKGMVRSGIKTALAVLRLEPSQIKLFSTALKKVLKRLVKPLGI